ncbi:MFS transporter [Pseudoroseomonas wenyumeiae]|uniref:MFS transporter n=1 Tax=Teichococcus wenyumeiae TaxID=2478470 RepID=A0A3A9JIA1_9PROT|nr:MFS transporter [Pseudoroseomonas wenyumeiae]RKK03404.1 MFS transporter [Pseudoroseomonas wenyumeiae]RMI26607.1 MFS transporter [Pseudoroseomonas wenyumeiae]
MFTAVRPVQSLLVSIFILMAGGGFMPTLVSVRLEGAGAGAPLIGMVGSAYFLGLTLGSLLAAGVIRRVGHIRAFACFVSLLSASTLAYALYQSVGLWAALRLIDGFCIAGVYVCLESWLNDRAEPSQRGSVLAAYMVALYAGQGLGQFLLNLGQSNPLLPFLLASILLSIAVLPISLTRSASPVLGDFQAMPMRSLYAASPLGMVGAAVTGLMLGAFYGLGAVHAQRIGLDLSATAAFMSAVILGGVTLQWPLGWLSDRFDRRTVILGAFAGAALVALAIMLLGQPGVLLLVLGCLFGGLSFALYPLCVAHTNDRLTNAQRVGASAGLVLVYSVGAAVGPLAGAASIAAFGTSGLYLFIASCAAATVAFGLWRLAARPAPPSEAQQSYQALPHTTPMSAGLDPLSEDNT